MTADRLYYLATSPDFMLQPVNIWPLPDAYERQLVDAIKGDASLFARNDGIEAAWRLMDPVLSGWAAADAPVLHTYPKK